MKSRHFLLVAIISLTHPGIGHAQNDTVRQCVSETADPDVKIASCAAIIQLSQETKEHLSIAYNDRGVAYHRKGQIDKAISDFNDAIRLDPNNAAAFNNRGSIYSKGDQYQRAIANFDEAIRLKPDYAVAWYNRSIAKQEIGDGPGADTDLSAALNLGLDGTSGVPWHFFRDPQSKFFVQFPADAKTPKQSMPGMAIYLALWNDELFQVTSIDSPTAPAKPDNNYFQARFADFARDHSKQIHSEFTLTLGNYPAAEAEMTDRAIEADYLVDVIVIPNERVYLVVSGGRSGHTRSPDARYFRNSFSLYRAALKLDPDTTKAQDELTSLDDPSIWHHTQPKQPKPNEPIPDFNKSMGGHVGPIGLPPVLAH